MNSARLTGGQSVVLTMHTVKEMELSGVALFDLSAGAVPNPWVLKGLHGEDLVDANLRARSLLKVAASRAHEELVVTEKGERSELLL
ncbi:hypothetical protein E3T39_11270 [Cryobacterium suzukii]|uniref:Uncharacterized protein n=1 Tax=Cryobacterium suzukii TaxID=1259198 RepID=A0A4R9AEC0_9MICO|nr:hypothetical protein [Cryobacterium suzukii]TFD58937.1 hypothetical protein E3T39_11270 [Cryobacterium suzukii]